MKINFERSIRFYENDLKKDGYNYRALAKYIELVIDFVKRLSNKNPELPPKDIKDVIYNSMQSMVYYYTENVDCGGLIKQRITCQQILQDNNFLEEEYKKIKDEDLNLENCNINYDEDEEYVKKDFVRTMLAHLRKQKEDITPEMLEVVKKFDKRKNTSSELRNEIEAIRPIITGSELNQLKEFMRYNNCFTEAVLKEKYIGLMIQIGDFFDGFKLLEKYHSIHKIDLRKIGMECLAYSLDSENDEKDTVSIKDIFKEEFLDKMDVDDLAIINTFWQNRFAKETKEINTAIFYINTLNLWEDIIKGNPIDINEEQTMDAIFLKSKVMEQIAKGILDDEEGVERFAISENENRMICDTTKSIDELNSAIGKKYKKYFDNILPQSENNLLEDIKSSIILYSNKENIYFCKDATIMSLMNTFINNKKIKNWGYMSEISSRGEKSTEAITDKKYVLIGIDYEGYNMPLRFHMRRDLLEDQLRAVSGNTIIPMYEGEEDFWYKKDTITTQVFLPLDKKHKKTIRELSVNCDEKDSRYKLIKHLDFLRKAENFPEHLKEEVVEGNKKVKKRNRKYIDISTGKQYTRENKNYVLIDDNRGSNLDEDGTR